MDYEFVSLPKVSSNGLSFILGHAMIWCPDKDIKLKLIVSNAAIERDFNETPCSNIKKHQKTGVKPTPHPGYSIREAVEKFADGLAYFNAGEMGMLKFPIIVDGKLVTKPKPIKVLFQERWEPINEDFTFFIQYPTGEVEIEDLPIRDNQFIANLPRGTYGFSAPYIVKDGKHIPLKNPPSGYAPNSQEVLHPGGKTQSPISAIGIDKQRRVVRISLVGDIDNPNDTKRFPTEYDLIYYLQEFNVVNALYTGASADVQYYDSKTRTLGIGPERPKSIDRKWVLREGQTERGITVIGVLMVAEGGLFSQDTSEIPC
jgi:hypothetical protein